MDPENRVALLSSLGISVHLPGHFKPIGEVADQQPVVAEARSSAALAVDVLAQMARVLDECLSQRRPLSQLEGLLGVGTGRVIGVLTRRRLLTDARVSALRAQLTRPDIIDACLVISSTERSLGCVLQCRRLDGRWHCTDGELLLPPAVLALASPSGVRRSG